MQRPNEAVRGLASHGPVRYRSSGRGKSKSQAKAQVALPRIKPNAI